MSTGETAAQPPEHEPDPENGPEDDGATATSTGGGPVTPPADEAGPRSSTPEEGDRDWDAEWASITSELGPRRPRYLMSDTPRVGAGQGARDYTPAEDPDENRFVPDQPERVGTSRAVKIAWAAIVAGPALMLLAVFAFDSAPPWYVATCLAIFLTGCVIGFTRLPGNRRDGGDGSAV